MLVLAGCGGGTNKQDKARARAYAEEMFKMPPGCAACRLVATRELAHGLWRVRWANGKRDYCADIDLKRFRAGSNQALEGVAAAPCP